jgi:hypothetical protein
MSFWRAEDKIPISQKSVSIPSQNGLEYSGGQRVLIQVPSSIEYIQPKECYLQFEVQIKLPPGKPPTFLQLDETLGAQSLIRDIRIFSSGAGKILLEEFQNYNVLTNLKYTYETNDVLRKKRSLTEGSTYHSVATRGTCGTTESHKNAIEENPYFKNNKSTVLTDADFVKVKCLLPINTGIFQNDRVFPVLMTEGLTLDITLENNDLVFRQLDQANARNRLAFAPLFHSVNGSLTAPSNLPDSTDIKSIFLANDNMINSVPNVPFCIGETLKFARLADGLATGMDEIMTISAISACTTNNLIKVDFSASGQVDEEVTASGTWAVVSDSVESQTSYDATYTISDVQLILQQLEMPQGYTQKMMSMMKEGGKMNYDFLSFTNYKYSQLSSDVVANIRLPLNMSRAKAILCIPTDATVLNSADHISRKNAYKWWEVNGTRDHTMESDKTALVGISDNVQDYQFFYDGKLNPSRKVDVSRTSTQVSISQQQLIELEKALSMSDITPYSFRGFMENYCLGRALSLHNGVYDTRGKDFNLQVEYTGAYQPSKNKLWNNYVAHIRRLEFSGNGISMQV